MKHRPPVRNICRFCLRDALGLSWVSGNKGIYYIMVYIPGVSTTIRFWGRLQKTYSYWVPLDIFLVISWKIPTVYIPNMCGLYILSVASLITRSCERFVLCFSCLMLDQAPSSLDQAPSSFQAQAHWNFLAEQLWIHSVSRAAGEKRLHIATLLQNFHGVWAHPLTLMLWCQLLRQFWRRTFSVQSDAMQTALSKKGAF